MRKGLVFPLKSTANFRTLYRKNFGPSLGLQNCTEPLRGPASPGKVQVYTKDPGKQAMFKNDFLIVLRRRREKYGF